MGLLEDFFLGKRKDRSFDWRIFKYFIGFGFLGCFLFFDFDEGILGFSMKE